MKQAALLALLLAALHLSFDTAPQRALRALWFDAQQRIHPRERINDSVVVVTIDDESLAVLGQWPWPRQRMAALLQKILAAQPAVVGVDVLFAEPDRYGPAPLALTLKQAGMADAAPLLASLPDGDAQLAQAIQGAPVVLGMFGLKEPAPTASTLPPSPLLVERGGSATGKLPLLFADVLRSLPVLTGAAAGEGLLEALPESGLIRRLPTLIKVQGQVVPGLTVEMLRVGTQAPALVTQAGGGGMARLGIGEYRIPTDPDGGWWLHYSPWKKRPNVSALALFTDPDAASILSGRMVLLGYTASGLLDVINTPLGPMPGVHAHAEALDNLLDGRLLQRPRWAAAVEALALLALALLAALVLQRRTPARAAGVWALGVAALFVASHLAFRQQGWLLDAVAPAFAAAAVLGLQLLASLARTRAQLQASREARARLDGELDAARRIQLGMLPDPAQRLAGEPRVQLAATMQAARSVGGDFYDCFLDGEQLWFLVADVSGKGLPAALFMALAKGALRRAAAQAPGDPGLALQLAAASLAGENAEQQFVTVLAGTLHLGSGALALASAGHEAPLRLSAGQAPSPIPLLGGPPLCVLDDFPYSSEAASLQPGEGLCLFTDGATDARNSKGEMLGREGWFAALAAAGDAPAEPTLQALRTRLERYVGTAELADDVTVLVLRWRA